MLRDPVLRKRPPARRAAAAAIRDPDASRARILDAAKAEFARYGLGGARVDRIAKGAGANKRMLYYYFGNKEALFTTVLEAAYEHIRAAEAKLSLQDVAPDEGVRRLVAFTWDYYLANPEFLTLLNTENLHEGQHLAGSSKIRTMNSPVIATLAAILRRGRRDGLFRADPDPLQLYISIAALAYFFLSNNHTLSAVFDRNLARPAARRARLAHMTELVLGYLRHGGG
ncbi:MAG: TetR/AcrR family transcriptional regulator [Betaproteobacteria bacterium]